MKDPLVIHDAADATAIAAACPTIYGTVILNNGTLKQDVDLSGVEVIEGRLVDGCVDSADSLSFGGSCYGVNSQDTSFGITSSTLSEIKGDMDLAGPPRLVHIDLPALQRVKYISMTASGLTNLSLPSLKQTGYLQLEGMTELTYLDISSLVVVNASLTLNAPNL